MLVHMSVKLLVVDPAGVLDLSNAVDEGFGEIAVFGLRDLAGQAFLPGLFCFFEGRQYLLYVLVCDLGLGLFLTEAEEGSFDEAVRETHSGFFFRFAP